MYMNYINIKSIKRYAFSGIFFSIALFSCDYLNIDNYADEQIKFDSIFTSKRYIEAYMWDAAGSFNDEGGIFGSSQGGIYTPGPMATDEAFCLFGTGEFQGMGYVLGEYNETNMGQMDQWGKMYQIIRQCNTIFANINKATDWTGNEKTRVLAYTRFVRAYAYYNLIVSYGPVVLMYDELLQNNETIEYYDRPRDLYDDAMEYICSEFEEAAKFLPAKVQSVLDFGLPTKGAALGLVARLRLIHASPMYNGGTAARMYFGSWTRKTDGKHYISQTYDPKRWAVAAAACKRVMDMQVDGLPLYKLHTVERDNTTPALSDKTDDPNYATQDFPNGAANIDPLHSYHDMFNGETVMNINPEFVWARNSATLREYTKHSFPVSNGGWNGMCVTQKIIDAYEMADGRSISDASEDYPYDETGFTTMAKDFSGYHLNAGVFNMYVNREPRFYASIGFSECFWPNSSTSESAHKNLTVTYYYDSPNGKSGAPNPNDHPITGYVLKKYVNPMDAWTGTSARRLDKPFPIIRYAEILLSYAEALNSLESEYAIEIDGISQTFSRNEENILNAYNQLRYRAGLPGLTYLPERETMLAKIKKERMIEFLYENRRYFDIRRWGDYEESENEPIRGMNTTGTKESYYQRVIPSSNRIINRQINRKFIFLPIPKVELKRLPSFDQNPGWE